MPSLRLETLSEKHKKGTNNIISCACCIISSDDDDEKSSRFLGRDERAESFAILKSQRSRSLFLSLSLFESHESFLALEFLDCCCSHISVPYLLLDIIKVPSPPLLLLLPLSIPHSISEHCDVDFSAFIPHISLVALSLSLSLSWVAEKGFSLNEK